MIPSRIFLMAVLVMVALVACVPPVAATTSARIQNDGSYVDSDGRYHVLGEVLNTGDTALAFVKVTATLKDANGQVVRTMLVYVNSICLPTGQKAPFQASEGDKAKSARVSSYMLALEPLGESPTPCESALAIQGISSSKTDPGGFFQVEGEIKNNGARMSNGTVIIGTFYDGAGKVVDLEYPGIMLERDISPGEASKFTLRVLDATISSRIQKYFVFAESQCSDCGAVYTSLSETAIEEPKQSFLEVYGTYIGVFGAVAIVIVVAVFVITRRRRPVAARIRPVESSSQEVTPHASLVAEKFCVNCGSRMALPDKFCGKCGAQQ